jgi:hypothetical protein
MNIGYSHRGARQLKRFHAAISPRRTGAPGAQGVSGQGHTGWVTHRWPTLTRWLEHASSTHPVRFLTDDPEAAYGPIGDSYEEMLSYLEDLSPKRLERKRRDFAANEGGVIELRTELLVGYRLGKGGVGFEFGNEGQPDYVCTTRAGDPAFVEVTTRILDGLADL